MEFINGESREQIIKGGIGCVIIVPSNFYMRSPYYLD
jgi:hypothetical protein